MKHHLCIHKDCTLFDTKIIPYGEEAIMAQGSGAIHDILDWVVPNIGRDVGDDDVYVCGEGLSRRMLGRKLEDRLKKRVVYE